MAADLMLWNAAADPGAARAAAVRGLPHHARPRAVLVDDGAGRLVCVLRCQGQKPAQGAGRGSHDETRDDEARDDEAPGPGAGYSANQP